MSRLIFFETEGRVVDPTYLNPNPFAARAKTAAALRSLSGLHANRTVVVVDETTPRNAAVYRLIRAGRIPSVIGNDGTAGMYWIRVNLPERARRAPGSNNHAEARRLNGLRRDSRAGAPTHPAPR
jgi:hypothetical protein